MGITKIVNENAVKCKITVFNPADVPNSTKIYVTNRKNNLQRPGRDTCIGNSGGQPDMCTYLVGPRSTVKHSKINR